MQGVADIARGGIVSDLKADIARGGIVSDLKADIARDGVFEALLCYQLYGMAQDEYLEWNLTASPYDRGTFQELALQHPPRAHRGSCRRQPPGPLV